MKYLLAMAITFGCLTNVASAQSTEDAVTIDQLFDAAEYCDMDMLKKGIVEQQMNVNVTDPKQRNVTLLMFTVRSNCHAGTQFLFEQGIDVNQANNIGYTALMGAASGGNVESVRLLLSHPNIQINKVLSEGNITALQVVKSYWVQYLALAISEEEELASFIERSQSKKQDNHDDVVTKITSDIEDFREYAARYAEIITMLEEAAE